MLGRLKRSNCLDAVRVLEVSWDVLDSGNLTPSELKVETTVQLNTPGCLFIGKARELAEIALWEFRPGLASRRIPTHYDEADLGEDVVRSLARIMCGDRPGCSTCR